LANAVEYFQSAACSSATLSTFVTGIVGSAEFRGLGYDAGGLLASKLAAQLFQSSKFQQLSAVIRGGKSYSFWGDYWSESRLYCCERELKSLPQAQSAREISPSRAGGHSAWLRQFRKDRHTAQVRAHSRRNCRRPAVNIAYSCS
jgi:hypothetical protein